MTSPRPDNGQRIEGVALVLILLAVGAMAAAASFTHVHDWTMANAPAGTGDWFGWANAVISDLVPLGVGLEVRRRRRHNLPIGWYPIAIIIAAASLSLAGQLAQAEPSPSGWLLAAVPALGFLALTKLVLSRPTTPVRTEPTAAIPVGPTAVHTGQSTMDVRPADRPAPTLPATPVVPATAPPRLLNGARFAVVNHEQATGRAITADELAARMSLTPDVAGQLLAALGEYTDGPPITAPHNGTRIGVPA